MCRVGGQQQYGAADSLYQECLIISDIYFFLIIFDNFSTKEELLTLLPLKTTTRGVDIWKAVKEFLVEKKVLLEKLVSVTTDGAPAMIG